MATLVSRMRQMNWVLDGVDWKNPFTQKITRQNVAGLGIPTYFDVIADPNLNPNERRGKAMDLGTIEQRLRKGKYEGVWANLINDVRLMVDNARAFNRPNEPVCVMANELWKQFSADIAQLEEMRKAKKAQEKEAKRKRKRERGE